MTSRRRRGEGANASVNIVRACFRSNRLNNHWEDRFGLLLDAISFPFASCDRIQGSRRVACLLELFERLPAHGGVDMKVRDSHGNPSISSVKKMTPCDQAAPVQQPDKFPLERRHAGRSSTTGLFRRFAAAAIALSIVTRCEPEASAKATR